MMLARVAAAGYEIVPEDIDADVVIVNTCAFIQSAKEEAIENILDLFFDFLGKIGFQLNTQVYDGVLFCICHITKHCKSGEHHRSFRWLPSGRYHWSQTFGRRKES